MKARRVSQAQLSTPHPDPSGFRSRAQCAQREFAGVAESIDRIVGLKLLREALAASTMNGTRAEDLLARACWYIPRARASRIDHQTK